MSQIVGMFGEWALLLNIIQFPISMDSFDHPGHFQWRRRGGFALFPLSFYYPFIDLPFSTSLDGLFFLTDVSFLFIVLQYDDGTTWRNSPFVVTLIAIM